MLEHAAKPALWPIFGLRLITDRLDLRPVTDSDLDELAALAHQGIHDPSSTPPWASLWTDRYGSEFEQSFAQYFWAQRARWSPADWTLPFVVRAGSTIVGVQQIEAVDFPTLLTVSTSSWLGRAYQGAGLGTEMRGAVLSFAFDTLGAEIAISSAFSHNSASRRVSEKLGYRRNGVRRENVAGKPIDAALFLLTRERWVADPVVGATVDGIESCLELLGVPTQVERLASVG
jgi:RimJ/RimL family protein N-acetyltransferase